MYGSMTQGMNEVMNELIDIKLNVWINDARNE